MKIVKICGIPHQIIDKEYIEGNGRVCGEITYDECIIKMREGMNPDYYNQTLIHEVVHGILVMIGRNDLSDDEIFVQTLALAISQTFDLKEEEKGCGMNTVKCKEPLSEEQIERFKEVWGNAIHTMSFEPMQFPEGLVAVMTDEYGREHFKGICPYMNKKCEKWTCNICEVAERERKFMKGDTE